MTEATSSLRGYFPRRWLILAMIFSLYALAVADRTTMSFAAPLIIDDLHIDSLRLGLVLSAFGWGYGIFGIPAGMFVDKLGAKKAMTLGLLIWSAATMAAGFANLVPAVVLFLFASRLVVGVGEAVVTPGSAKVLAMWFPDRERGRASSIWASATYISVAALAPVMAWICQYWGWKQVFWIMGGLGLLAVVLWRRLYYDPTRHPRIHPDEFAYIVEGGALVNLAEQTAQSASETHEPAAFSEVVGRVIQLLKQPQLLAIFFGQYCGNSIAFFMATWLPTYLVKGRGINILHAGFMVAIPSAAAAVSLIAVGAFMDLIYRRTGSLALSRKIPLTVGYLLCSTIVLFKFGHSELMIGALILIAYMGKGCANLGWTLITDVAPRALVGTAGGMLNAIGNLGPVVTSVLIGAVVQKTGSYDWALVYVAAHGILAVIVFWLFMPQMTRVVVKA